MLGGCPPRAPPRKAAEVSARPLGGARSAALPGAGGHGGGAAAGAAAAAPRLAAGRHGRTRGLGSAEPRSREAEQPPPRCQRSLPRHQRPFRRGQRAGPAEASNLTHYFSPAAIANNPTRALLLIGAILLAYWFLSLFLGFFFYLLHMLFGRFFWIARVALFTLSCVYILQKYEGDPEHAVLPLCFVVAVYFMTGPVGFYWRRNSNSSLEEKMDHLDSQIRLLNIRLSRVIENLDRGSDQ
uniref:BRI3 binding protein n=1 Tax=Otus sunia TaxID=257818 RepID=A0A8C8A8P1_9STRI